MNVWMLAAVALAVALAPCLGVCALCAATDALAALEVAGTVVATILMLLAEGYRRQPFIDLAITFALVSMLGAFAFARLMERDL